LQQISTKDYNIVQFAHTFYFNNQCQTVSEQPLIFLKFNLPLSVIKSESDRKTGLQIRRMQICEKATESDGFESRFEIHHISKSDACIYNTETYHQNLCWRPCTLHSPWCGCHMSYLYYWHLCHQSIPFTNNTHR